MAKSPMLRKFAKMLRSTNGNFAMISALMLPVLFMAGSLAVDTTNMISMKTRMQNAVDSAALATATRLLNEEGLTVLEAQTFAEKFLNGQLEEDLPAYADMSVKPTVTVTPAISANGVVWNVSVLLSGTQSLTPMARLFGKETMTVDVLGKAESGTSGAQGSFSMALVLDQSGSMSWSLGGLQKIVVLKTAVANLTGQFIKADPAQKYVRVGASSYNSSLKGTVKLSWDPAKVTTFVNLLLAGGGTDSTDAFNWAYKAVIDKNENVLHDQRSGQVPKKFIVFMTDGDNNYNSADTSTKILCDAAKKNGVEIYSVAFAAPSGGKALLSYCASSADHFFDAKNSAELIAAFDQIGKQTSKLVSRLTQ